MLALGLVGCAAIAPSCGICPADAPGAAGNFNASSLGVTAQPTGNAWPTMTTFNVQGTTGADAQREFAVNLGLLSNRGADSPSTPFRDKVTLYVGMEAAAGTGDVWSINPLLTQAPKSGSYNAQGIELDFNNENAHRGEADAGAGLAPPVSYGLSVSGAAPFRSTAAIGVMGNRIANGEALWNRGIVFANNCVAQSSFQDLGDPQKSVDIRGNPEYGVYQSSAQSRNYLAGKTGVGPAALGGDATLEVDGDVAFSGRLVRTSSAAHGERATVHGSLLGAPNAPESLSVLSGNAELDPNGSATITLPPESHSLLVPDTHRYLLTPLGAPMPSLHVAAEVHALPLVDAAASGPRLAFRIAGGVPEGRASWQLTSTLR